MPENDCNQHIRVMRNIVYTEREYQCRNCTDSQLKECYSKFKPHDEFATRFEYEGRQEGSFGN